MTINAYIPGRLHARQPRAHAAGQFTCFTSTKGVSLVAFLVPEHLHETAEGEHVACAGTHLAVLVNYYTSTSRASKPRANMLPAPARILQY